MAPLVLYVIFYLYRKISGRLLSHLYWSDQEADRQVLQKTTRKPQPSALSSCFLKTLKTIISTKFIFKMSVHRGNAFYVYVVHLNTWKHVGEHLFMDGNTLNIT